MVVSREIMHNAVIYEHRKDDLYFFIQLLDTTLIDSQNDRCINGLFSYRISQKRY